MPANPISKHQRQTVQHVLWVLPKFCQLSDISKLKRNWYTLVKYVYHYFSHGYLFPDRKKSDFSMTFLEKFAAKKSNKWTKFVDTDSNMVLFFLINHIVTHLGRGLKAIIAHQQNVQHQICSEHKFNL